MSRPSSAHQKSRSIRSGGGAFFFTLVLAVIAAAVFLWPRTAKIAPTARAVLPPTVANTAPPPGMAPPGMVWIPGGEFSMGTDDPTEMICGGPDAMPDARPIHRVYVDGFWMDTTEVTNEEFERFVKATGYITVAERTPRQEDFPDAPPENLVAGSVVFKSTPAPVALNNHLRWWEYAKGANWRHPEGAESDLKSRERHPVVHI